MNWNALTVSAVCISDGVSKPIRNLNVRFSLFDQVLDRYYYFDRVTDSEGIAVLPARDTLLASSADTQYQSSTDRGLSSENKDNGVLTRTTLNNSDALNVATWFVESEYDGVDIYSQTYGISNTEGELSYTAPEKGNNNNTTNISIIVEAYRNGNLVLIPGATVVIWLYQDNSRTHFITRLSGVTDYSGVCNFINIPQNAYYYIVNGFYDTFYNAGTTMYSISLYFRNTIILDSKGNGFIGSIEKLENLDTLYYYIGENTAVLPVNIVLKDDNGTPLLPNPIQMTNQWTSQSFTCTTQYLIVENIPTGASATYYVSSATRVDLFSYVGLTINKLTTLSPRKQYTLRAPVVYDTRELNIIGNEVPGFNLPNTDIELYFNCYGYNHSQSTSSNISAITFTTSAITTTNINKNYFYKCLAGADIDKIHFKLSKHHYDDTVSNAVVSGKTYNGNSYCYSSNTINYLYFCKYDEHNKPISTINKAIKITREPNAVFTRQEIQDYVRGFGYEYNEDRSVTDSRDGGENPGDEDGNNNNGGNVGNVTNNGCNYTGFTLRDLERCPASKRTFYGESIMELTGFDENDFLNFKKDFIGNLNSGQEFYTRYTDNGIEENVYGDNNNHCYVLEESIIPSGSSAPNYFYFYNKTGSADFDKLRDFLIKENDVPLEDLDSIASFICNLIESTVRKEITISLEKIGNPSYIQLEYSFDELYWKNYVIGDNIVLPPGSNVRFRANNVNTSFSLSNDDYYKFNIQHNYDIRIFVEGQTETDETILEKYGTDICGYALYAGGRISSLLDTAVNSNAQNNSYCFCNLFKDCDITNTEGVDANYKFLNLDLMVINGHAYQNMFSNTKYIKNGPKISATGVGEYSMAFMFSNSSLKELYDDTLRFHSPSTGTCYEMFSYSDYNSSLIFYANITENLCFKRMFYGATHIDKKIKLRNIDIFAASACSEMFCNSGIEVFPDFNEEIVAIYNCAFEKAFYNSNITSIDFKVNGSVGSYGCSQMFSEINNDDLNISGLLLGVNTNLTLGAYCFYKMFENTRKAYGRLSFMATSIPPYGCADMFYNAANLSSNGIESYVLIPVVINDHGCYRMFYNAHLKYQVAPCICATTLAESSCELMFACSNLTHHYELDTPTKEDLYAITEYELRAEILPNRCYYGMYSATSLECVSNILSNQIRSAGNESCSHMFEGTPIKTENTVRRIKRHYNSDNSNVDLTIRHYNYPYLMNAHSIFVYGNSSNEDNCYHVGKDIYLDNSEEGVTYVKLLTDCVLYGFFGTQHWLMDKDSPKLYATINYNGSGVENNITWYVAQQSSGDYLGNIERAPYYDSYTHQLFVYEAHATNWFDETANLVIRALNREAVYKMKKIVEISQNSSTIYIWYWEDCGGHHTFSYDTRTWTTIGRYSRTDYDDEYYPLNIPPVRNHFNESYSSDLIYYEKGKEIVNLTATAIGEGCYSYMFSQCEKLYYGHNFILPDNISLAKASCSHMFYGCKELRTIIQNLDTFEFGESACTYMYANCSHNYAGEVEVGLNYVTKGIIKQFDYHQGLEHVYDHTDYSVDFTSKTTDSIYCESYPNVDFWSVGGIKQVFNSNNLSQSLIEIGTGKTLGKACFSHMFANTYSISLVNINLLSETSESCYEAMFYRDYRLMFIVRFGKTINTAKESCFKNMFFGCASYANIMPIDNKGNSALTATQLEESCYERMFAGCCSMIKAPELPATTLATNCYREMFMNNYDFVFIINYSCLLYTDKGTKTLCFGLSGSSASISIYYYLSGCSHHRDTYVAKDSDTHLLSICHRYANVDKFENFSITSDIGITFGDYTYYPINRCWTSMMNNMFFENREIAKSYIRNWFYHVFPVDENEEPVVLYRQDSQSYFTVTGHSEVHFISEDIRFLTREQNYMITYTANISRSDLENSSHPYTSGWFTGLVQYGNTRFGFYKGPQGVSQISERSKDTIPNSLTIIS